MEIRLPYRESPPQRTLCWRDDPAPLRWLRIFLTVTVAFVAHSCTVRSEEECSGCDADRPTPIGIGEISATKRVDTRSTTRTTPRLGWRPP